MSKNPQNIVDSINDAISGIELEEAIEFCEEVQAELEGTLAGLYDDLDRP